MTSMMPLPNIGLLLLILDIISQVLLLNAEQVFNNKTIVLGPFPNRTKIHIVNCASLRVAGVGASLVSFSGRFREELLSVAQSLPLGMFKVFDEVLSFEEGLALSNNMSPGNVLSRLQLSTWRHIRIASNCSKDARVDILIVTIFGQWSKDVTLFLPLWIVLDRLHELDRFLLHGMNALVVVYVLRHIVKFLEQVQLLVLVIG